ncbi:MAG: hypothetical protein R6V28_12685 [Nitriliruptoraceae bacterium]
MEPATPLAVPAPDAADASAPAAPVDRAEQAPVDRAEQTMLPLDLPASAETGALERSSPSTTPTGAGTPPADAGPDQAQDQPIGFALTARARRAVAPGTLPELSVVGGGSRRPAAPGDGALEEPDDTRPARARALRRAGVPVSAIVRQLDADPLAVTAWVGEVAPSTRHDAPVAAEASDPAGVGPAGVERADVVSADVEPPDVGSTAIRSATAATAEQESEVAAQLARAAAADLARQRLRDDPGFGVAVGLLAATATTDRHAVTITASDARQVARALQALAAQDPAVPSRLRVIVRVGPRLAGDLVRHRVAAELGVDAVQVSWTRWRSAPQPDAVQLLVRIAEPSLAASVAGWIDAALEPDPQPLDLAF